MATKSEKKRREKLPPILTPSRQEADLPAATQDASAPPADLQPPDLSHIPPELHGLAVRCDSLVFDEHNCVEHSEENLDAITGSLQEFGQRVLVVYNKNTRVIEKGNGTVRSALMLSAEDPRWQYVAAIGFDDEEGKGAAFAIADNRTAQLAKWRPEVLKQQLGKVTTNYNDKLEKMMGDLADKTKLWIKKKAEKDQAGDSDDPQISSRWEVIVECDDEEQQKQVFEELQAAGRKCRLVTF